MAKEPMPTKLGRYNIVRELGKGAMGVVYEGLDPTINRRVAIKTARRDVMEVTGRADEMMARFLREATAAGGLNHPNIITIYDAGEEGDMAYIAMEFLEGGDLFDLMERKRRFTPEEAVDIAAKVCDALAVAHDQGIVHRDVKPANIMTPDNAPLKVADFGIARIENSNLTQEGAMIGTPHYMSPEQFMGQRADGRSDLFSVGIILYEMLTGEKPFGGEALSTVMHNVIKGTPNEPHELNYAVNDCLSAVVMKALSKRPQERYQSGREMAAALREALKPNPNPAVTQVEASGDGREDVAATVMAGGREAAATVVSPSQFETGATAVSKPKRVKKKVAPPVEEEVEVEEAAPRRGLPLPALIGGGAVLLLIVVAVVAKVMGGGGAPKDASPGGGGTGGGTEAYFKSAQIKLYHADNLDAYSEASEIITSAGKERPNLSKLSGVTLAKEGVVCIQWVGSDDPPIEVPVSSGFGTYNELGKDWKEINAFAKEDPGNRLSFVALEPGQVANIWIVVLKK